MLTRLAGVMPQRRLLARSLAGLSIVALAVLALTPGQFMIRTGVLTGHQEHFLAYLISGCTVAFVFRRSYYAGLGLAFCWYAALLELGQFAVPGRHPAFLDFSASTFGAFAGIGLAIMLRRSPG